MCTVLLKPLILYLPSIMGTNDITEMLYFLPYVSPRLLLPDDMIDLTILRLCAWRQIIILKGSLTPQFTSLLSKRLKLVDWQNQTGLTLAWVCTAEDLMLFSGRECCLPPMCCCHFKPSPGDTGWDKEQSR